ncbi:hypothetical protein AAFF_G00029450 [Aldrovandia affinis]|uniref:Uncharacterized protein n=1 Tax=Aldrovandia affinis TaxID=143900 RepID=A0AAD7S4C9_9TELE|nr:hypothetical protein AAFF_G00029450 [Aldrovandia affinis]
MVIGPGGPLAGNITGVRLRHRPGRQHGNADTLLWRPCAAAGCEHCPRQEARAQLAPTVATLRIIDGEAGCLPLSPVQVQEEQERDAALTHVRSWLAAGKRPEWADVATLGTETRAYHSQWGGLERGMAPYIGGGGPLAEGPTCCSC